MEPYPFLQGGIIRPSAKETSRGKRGQPMLLIPFPSGSPPRWEGGREGESISVSKGVSRRENWVNGLLVSLPETYRGRCCGDQPAGLVLTEALELVTSSWRTVGLPSPLHTGASAVCSLAVAPHLAVIGFTRYFPASLLLAQRRVERKFYTRHVGTAVVRLLASQLGEPGSIPGWVAPGFSHVRTVPDDVAGRRVFSRISRFPYPLIPEMLHTQLASPSSALKTSIIRRWNSRLYREIQQHVNKMTSLVTNTTRRLPASSLAARSIILDPRLISRSSHILSKGICGTPSSHTAAVSERRWRYQEVTFACCCYCYLIRSPATCKWNPVPKEWHGHHPYLEPKSWKYIFNVNRLFCTIQVKHSIINRLTYSSVESVPNDAARGIDSNTCRPSKDESLQFLVCSFNASSCINCTGPISLRSSTQEETKKGCEKFIPGGMLATIYCIVERNSNTNGTVDNQTEKMQVATPSSLRSKAGLRIHDSSSSAKIKVRREREIHKKTRRPATSSGTIPTYENPEVTRPGIEPGSPWWKVSRLTAQPPRPQQHYDNTAHQFIFQRVAAMALPKRFTEGAAVTQWIDYQGDRENSVDILPEGPRRLSGYFTQRASVTQWTDYQRSRGVSVYRLPTVPLSMDILP
ncbi:hypothetical protein PR048_028897 [Dryococelus australis]|uniref:Uncharacterized protein n=1 Tax=Dryococelus australis TaxID=614101 RepID=A0ABQ9GBV5_9NEOP|nr:hypothetical protein PR048_028897 [Dryococelus australis]